MNALIFTLSLFCREPALIGECRERIEASMTKLGCRIEATATRCQYALIDDPKNPGRTIQGDAIYCEVASENCAKPDLGNFGGETCSQGTKSTIPRGDRIHNGYWFGYWPFYSRTICIK